MPRIATLSHWWLRGARKAFAPPPLDEFFGGGEAAGRARELEALGLSEESIWGGG